VAQFVSFLLLPGVAGRARPAWDVG
jgi:hypothetical protein